MLMNSYSVSGSKSSEFEKSSIVFASQRIKSNTKFLRRLWTYLMKISFKATKSFSGAPLFTAIFILLACSPNYKWRMGK